MCPKIFLLTIHIKVTYLPLFCSPQSNNFKECVDKAILSGEKKG